MSSEVETIKELQDYVKKLENPEILDKNFYTIVAPQSLRPNTDYKLTLTLHDSEDKLSVPCVAKISIRNEDDASKYNIDKEVTLDVNTTKELVIPIGDIPVNCNYKLVTEGLSGIMFKHEASLNIESKNYSIMIQTDKAMYKANDVVRFRVLVLNTKLCPAQLTKDILNVYVTDPKSNRIKQWSDVELELGVFEASFEISDLPNLGYWIITAEVGEEKKTKDIEIAEYVLPRFKVEVEAPNEFTVKDEVVRAVVSAKYTYGKPLKGKATVEITEKDPFGWPRFHLVDADLKEEKSLCKKTIDIDGRGSVEFNIEKELTNFGGRDRDYRDFEIAVEVEEELTGLTQKAKKFIKVYKFPYKLSCDLNNEEYKAGQPVSFTIFVRNRDDSPITVDEKNDKISIIREQFIQVDEDSEQEIKTTTKHKLSPKGELNITWDTAEKERNFTIQAIYEYETVRLGYFYALRPKDDHEPPEKRKYECLTTKILTENPAVNKELEVEILSAKPLQNYSYQLVARGKLIKSETVVVPNNTSNVLRFKFLATYDLVPIAHLIVYFVQDARIIDSKTTIELRENLANYVDLSLSPDTAKAGETVDISVKSNPKSSIYLLGVDQSVLLLKSGNDLSMGEALSELQNFNKISTSNRNYYDPVTQERNEKIPQYYNEWDSFSEADTILFTNTVKPIPKCVAYSLCCARAADCMMMAEPKVRKDFPETWLWDSIPGDSFSGALTIPKKVPDTITSWIVTGFAVAPDTGLGLTKESKKLTVFQPFFISLNLPYSVKRGEVVTVPCTVFNYMENDLEAEVTLENEHNEFEFIAGKDGESTQDSVRKNKIHIKSNNGVTTSFVIKPTHVGMISLKVKAVSPMAGDAIIRILNVQPEGVPQFFNKAVFVDLREKSKMEPTSLQIDIPKAALPDSTRIEVSCVGDLLGGTIKNLQNLIRLPCGCGEQNMLNFVPNIVILNYLKNSGQLTAEIETKVKKYTEIGYQRELNYKHPDGSFSAFGGKGDKCGSTWLTAFVAKSFQRAAEHIFIDAKMIEEALDYLKGVQNEDGSFAEKGSMLCKEMQGGSCNNAALTAYVLTAFLEYKNNKYEETIKKATKCLTESLKSVDDIYTLAVVAYALQLLNSELKEEMLKKLLAKAKTDESHKWWDKTVEIDHYGHKQSKTINVEMTSYALLTLLEANQDSQCLPILKWLLNQRNNQGGFEGTQDTVVGIEALAKFASKITTKNTDVKINVQCPDQKAEQNFKINKDNLLLLQTEKLPSQARTINVTAAGKGFALLEVSYRYNIKDVDPQPAFALKVKTNQETSAHLSLEIDACFQPPKGSAHSNRSNMAVLEVSFPSGFIVNTESFNELPDKIDLIKKVETKNGDTVAVIYFDHLTKEFLKLNLDGFMQYSVSEQKPSSIVLYDYYDNSLSAREFYSMKPTEK